MSLPFISFNHQTCSPFYQLSLSLSLFPPILLFVYHLSFFFFFFFFSLSLSLKSWAPNRCTLRKVILFLATDFFLQFFSSILRQQQFIHKNKTLLQTFFATKILRFGGHEMNGMRERKKANEMWPITGIAVSRIWVFHKITFKWTKLEKDFTEQQKSR